jgi:hypothetical protein
VPEPVAWEGLLVSHAVRAVGEGLSGNEFLRQVRESGAGVRRQVGLRAYAAARALVAEYGLEPTRPLDHVPSFAEARQWPTRASEGVLQTVRLFYREETTGRVVDRFYNVKTPAGLTRAEAIRQAIDANIGNASRYRQALIGAFHTGTAVLVAGAAA